ncbi:universal stress protein [Methanocella sp. CWC-04]|uniref:Universal stress protein n=1 Tax=Methanooceanicella nereidis TaxID=2052831 RepID=A0AAP2W772_9EURY|nr:universal stress protein [Methanocella sp. CWC-04]MCD1294929.1 universal stress protein [Methanocella sp. CWC-04]
MSEIFNKILIATDGSKRTQKAVEKGLAIARIHKSKVYAVYVVDTVTFTSIPMDVTWENMYQLLKEEGEEAVRLVKEMAGVDIDIESHVLEGNPALEICKFSRDNDVDLIVLGTLGKSGIDRLLLGSVAEKVVRIAPCPVMVIKSEVSETSK